MLLFMLIMTLTDFIFGNWSMEWSSVTLYFEYESEGVSIGVGFAISYQNGTWNTCLTGKWRSVKMFDQGKSVHSKNLASEIYFIWGRYIFWQFHSKWRSGVCILGWIVEPTIDNECNRCSPFSTLSGSIESRPFQILTVCVILDIDFITIWTPSISLSVSWS